MTRTRRRYHLHPHPHPHLQPLLLLFLLPLLLASSGFGQCMTFGRFSSQGKLPTGLKPAGTLEEVSGLEMSRTNENVLWMHDDKGAGAYLTAVSTGGRVRQQYLLANSGNLDWEDIAIGPGPQLGRDYIYLGDIGDNSLSRLWISLIRIAEPKVPASAGQTMLINQVEVFNCQYPNGPHDAEVLIVDPRDGTPYILTKETGNTAFLYRYPLPLDSSKTKKLVLAATFNHGNPTFSAGDVSPDGRWIYARNKNTVYAWPRSDTQTFAAAFKNKACTLGASNQGNAEGLAVAPNGTDLWAVSEGKGSDIWRVLGVLPQGRRAVPGWWNYGQGLGSAKHGVPGLGMVQSPVIGKATASLVVHGAAPGGSVVLALSATQLRDGQVAFVGGWLNVQPMLLLAGSLTGSGELTMKLGAVPNNPGLDGVQVFAQAAVADRGAPQGITLSSGLVIQLGK